MLEVPGASVQLAGKDSEGTQFYKIDVLFPDEFVSKFNNKLYYVFKSRFSSLKQFKDTNHFHSTNDLFPSIFSLTKDAETKRFKLEAWLKALVKSYPTVLHQFIQQEIKKYGDQTPQNYNPAPTSNPASNTNTNTTNININATTTNSNNNNSNTPGAAFENEITTNTHPVSDPIITETAGEEEVDVTPIEEKPRHDYDTEAPADEPQEVFLLTKSFDLRLLNTTKGNMPKVGRITPNLPIAAYGARCLFSADYDGIVTAYYIPWGRSAVIATGSGTKMVSMALQDERVLWIWDQTENFLGFVNLLEGVYHKCTPFKKYDSKILYSHIAVIGDSVHVIGPYFPNKSHHVYSISNQTWKVLHNQPLPTKYEYGDSLLKAVIPAREYIWVYSQASKFYVFDLNTSEWSQPKVPFSATESLVTMAWDKYNLIYVWTNEATWTYNLDTLEWKSLESAVLSNCLYAFATNDFKDQSRDIIFEDALATKHLARKKAPWNELYSKDDISEEHKDALVLFDKLPLPERVQFFKKDKDTLVKIFNQMTKSREGGDRIMLYLLQLLREMPEVEKDFPALMRDFVKYKVGDTVYFAPRSNNADGYAGKNTEAAPSSLPSAPGPQLTFNFDNTSTTTIDLKDLLHNYVRNSAASPASSSSTTTTQTTTSTSSASANNNNSGLVATKVDVLSASEIERRNGICLKLKSKNTEVPDHLMCPITQQILFDPVFTVDGHTYEKVAIQEWFSTGHKTSPLTNEPLDRFEIFHAHAMRKAVDYFLLKNEV